MKQLLPLFFVLLYQPAFSAVISRQDIPYYNFEADRAFVFFADGGDIYRAKCKAGKIINTRSDCDLTNRQKLFSTDQATSYFLDGFIELTKKPAALKPLTIESVRTLLAGPPQNQSAMLEREKELNEIVADRSALLTKFGANAVLQKQLDSAKQEHGELMLKLEAYKSYDTCLKDFEFQVQAFLRLITDSTKFTDLVASKNEGSIWAVFAEVMSQKVSGEMDFVSIPSANQTFQMGSPPSEPKRGTNELLHAVTLTHNFEMQTTVVTQAQWFAVMANNPSANRTASACPTTYRSDLGGGMCPQNPVDNVTFNDAVAFLQKMNAGHPNCTYRLPTEAEWEFAARGGTATAYYFGDDESKLPNYAWFEGNSKSHSHEVAQKSPNQYGLYDMAGNVWQWVMDSYSDYSSSAVTNPFFNVSGQGRVLRGASYGHPAYFLRAAYRAGEPESIQSSYFGFRLARTCR